MDVTVIFGILIKKVMLHFLDISRKRHIIKHDV